MFLHDRRGWTEKYQKAEVEEEEESLPIDPEDFEDIEKFLKTLDEPRETSSKGLETWRDWA